MCLAKEKQNDELRHGEGEPGALRDSPPRVSRVADLIPISLTITSFKTASESKNILYVFRRQRLELTCEVDGNPPPRIYWVTGEDPARQVGTRNTSNLSSQFRNKIHVLI